MTSKPTHADIKTAFLAAFCDPQFMTQGMPIWQGMNTFLRWRIDFHEVLDDLAEGHPFSRLWAAFCDLDYAQAALHEARKLVARNPSQGGGMSFEHHVVTTEQYLEGSRADFEKVCIDLRTCLVLGLAART